MFFYFGKTENLEFAYFRNEKNMTALFTKYASLFTELDGVWSQVDALMCQADGQTFVKSVRDLAYVLYE